MLMTLITCGKPRPLLTTVRQRAGTRRLMALAETHDRLDRDEPQ